MPRHLFFVLLCNGVVNSGERVVKNGVCDLLIDEIAFKHSIFDIWNGMR
jgi:hypothetical protein